MLTQYCSCDLIEKNKKGGACSAYGERRGVYSVLWENLKDTDHLEDQGVDGRIILSGV
jgi:hypothetical protein